MKQKRSLQSLREAGYRYLGTRARSTQEMTIYLQRKQQAWKLPPDSYKNILQELQHEQLLQDAEFGTTWVESKRISRHYGPQKLIAQLRQKGLESSDIQHALRQVSQESWEGSARTALKKYLAKSTFHSPEDQLRKSIDFLLRKGFSGTIARRAFDAISRTE